MCSRASSSFVLKAQFAAVGTALVILPGTAGAWSGDPWGDLTRDAIKANADLMIDSTWVPGNTFTNYEYGSTYNTYVKGVAYTGVPYSQDNPQENWTEFYAEATSTGGGSVGYGNDCSGFVSICWKLPARETTALFESNLGTLWTSLGDIGSVASVSLLMGDALNCASDHILMFLDYQSGGIRSMEQTPDNAQRRLWSYSALANYRPIRRAQLTDAPLVAAGAISRVVDAGHPVSLTISASGNAPLAYQWQKDGTNVADATSSTLAFSSAHIADTGDYRCVVSNAYGEATSGVLSLTVYPPQTTIFLDDFETNSAANWTVNQSSTDTRVSFHYNYAADGIPSAPHSAGGTTYGVKLEANLTAGVVAALSLTPLGQSFTNDYRLRFDMWINVNGPLPAGGRGSTEFLTAGLGTAGNRAQWTGSGTTADGYWFSVDGDGGVNDSSTTSGDYCAYIGTALQAAASGVYVAGSDASARGNLNAYYLDAIPGGLPAPTLQQMTYTQQTGALNPGAAGFAWHEAIVSRRGSAVEWSLDGAKLAAIPNASLGAGNIFVGFWDPFASLTDNTNLSFGLVDNVRVEVPAAAPAVLVQPQNNSVKLASNATFRVTATGLPAPAYQWLFNGSPIGGATNSNFARANVCAGDAGMYSVLITNVAGSVTSSNALLSVIPSAPARFQGACRQTDSCLLLSGRGDSGGLYIFETSTNLHDWTTLTTLTATNGAFQLNAGPTTNGARRFFRARSGP